MAGRRVAVGIVVVPRPSRGTTSVAATLGALQQAIDNFHIAPFVAAVREQVGAPVDQRGA